MKKARARPVIRVNANGDEVTFPSVKDAAAAVRVAASRITYACRTGTKCATFYWRYADE